MAGALNANDSLGTDEDLLAELDNLEAAQNKPMIMKSDKEKEELKIEEKKPMVAPTEEINNLE